MLSLGEDQLRIDLTDQLGRAAAGCGEHRQPAGHALQNRQREVLERAAAHLQVGSLHQRTQAGWVAVAGQLDVVLQPVGPHQPLEAGLLGSATGDHQTGVGPAAAHRGEGGDESIELLDADQSADAEHDRSLSHGRSAESGWK